MTLKLIWKNDGASVMSAFAVAVVPSAVLLYAYATGPDPRYTGAPGDNKLACAASGR